MFADAFAEIAADLSEAFDGPFHVAAVIDQTKPVYDDGGSIVDPGEPVRRRCLVQGDVVTEAMRQSDGYREKDVRLIVIQLAGDLNTDAVVEIGAGPHAGVWSIQSVERDTLGFGWSCRGRAA